MISRWPSPLKSAVTRAFESGPRIENAGGPLKSTVPTASQEPRDQGVVDRGTPRPGDQVEPAIAIQVEGGEAGWGLAVRVNGDVEPSRAEGAVSMAREEGQVSGKTVVFLPPAARRDEVDMAVAVEIAGHHRFGRVGHCDGPGGGEAPVGLGHQDREVVGAEVGRHEVGPAVAVQVNGQEVDRRQPYLGPSCRAERAVAVVGSDPHVVRFGLGDDQVGPSVAVEVNQPGDARSSRRSTRRSAIPAHQPLSRHPGAARQAVHQGHHGDVDYTWSRFREKVAPLNPWEDSSRSA